MVLNLSSQIWNAQEQRENKRRTHAVADECHLLQACLRFKRGTLAIASNGILARRPSGHQRRAGRFNGFSKAHCVRTQNQIPLFTCKEYINPFHVKTSLLQEHRDCKRSMPWISDSHVAILELNGPTLPLPSFHVCWPQHVPLQEHNSART